MIVASSAVVAILLKEPCREPLLDHIAAADPAPGIGAPTLLLAGSDSVPVVAEATRRAAAAIPGARVHVLDGHAHFAHKTDPAMVAAIVRSFTAPGGRAAGG